MAITHTYSPDAFALVPMSQLAKQHFDLHPIWSEYYDDDEWQEIVSWGVDRQWLDAALRRIDDGSDHFAYTVLRPFPLPARMRLYIKARFVTAGGVSLEGYVMNDDAYVVTLFAGESEFSFSRHPTLADLNEKSLHGLRRAIGNGDDSVFPLWYETDFRGDGDRPIKGHFVAGAR